VYKVSKKQVIL